MFKRFYYVRFLFSLHLWVIFAVPIIVSWEIALISFYYTAASTEEQIRNNRKLILLVETMPEFPPHEFVFH